MQSKMLFACCMSHAVLPLLVLACCLITLSVLSLSAAFVLAALPSGDPFVSLMDASIELDESLALVGISAVAQFLAQSGTPVPIEAISAVYMQKEWDNNRCLSHQELSEVALACGLHAWNSPIESADRQPLGDDSLVSAEVPEQVPDVPSESLDLAEAIVLREQKGQFPLIQPGELENPQIVEFATHVMLLLRPQDQVQLKIFLKNKYNQYQLSSCDAVETSRAQSLVAFAKDSYFEDIFEFLLIETLRAQFPSLLS